MVLVLWVPRVVFSIQWIVFSSSDVKKIYGTYKSNENTTDLNG
ncbi:hypothetical protein [Flavobacterium sp. UBA7682]|nr:hypothetical protein [Flavobacterium sp. UBA7682]